MTTGETIIAALTAWTLLSAPAALFIARFIRAGR